MELYSAESDLTPRADKSNRSIQEHWLGPFSALKDYLESNAHVSLNFNTLEMSMLHAIHEVHPISPSRAPEIEVNPNVPETETQHVPDSTPRAGQPVFERTLPSRTTQSRRVTITTLLVLANVVQVWH
jgi:hypothetical protein